MARIEDRVANRPVAALAVRAWRDFRVVRRQSLVFHLLMQLLGLALFTPILSWMGELIVSSTGEAVISNYDIAVFVLSPTGALFVLIGAALVTGLLLAELAGQTFLAGHAIGRRPVTVISAVAFVARRMHRLIGLATRVFLLLTLLLLRVLAIAVIVWFTMLGEQDINYYLAENPVEWRGAKLIVGVAALGYALLVAWQLTRWVYAVPILVFEGTAPAAALAASARMTQGRVVAIAAPLVSWWLLLTGATIAITWVCRQISDAGLVWAGMDLQRVLPLVALYLAVVLIGGFIYSALQMAGHQFLVTRMYGEQRDPGKWVAPANLELDDQLARRVARPAIFATSVLVVFALGFGWFLATRLDLVPDVAVTAHRGASLYAPENTMAAFRGALDAGANYVELDVQHARDGQIVVIHDRDFMRVGGDPRRVGELTVDELATIDIGKGFGAAFSGERAPLLVDVIALARGKMKINIELKYNVPDPGLAPAVIELLKRENFLDQVVITSLDPDALRQVESIEPALQTGHIVTASVGNVLLTEADFLSMSSARATPSLVRRAHAAGKEVHVWTVNKPEVMLRMIEAGVDNVITDDPVLLARVLRDRHSLSKTEILALRLRVLFTRTPPELTDPAAVEEL